MARETELNRTEVRVGRIVKTFFIAVAAVLVLVPASALGHERTAPLPGGTYTGKTTLGKRVVFRVSGAPAGTYRASMRVPCAGVRAPIRIDGAGHYAVEQSSGGNVVFSATGKFTRLTFTEGSISVLDGATGSCAPASFRADLTDPVVAARTINYGPFSVPADSEQQFTRSSLARPCSNCYLVGMEPDLVYADGTRATHDTGAHLHHVVFYDQSGTDATCSGWPERFFASGDERTPFALPKGYGYPVASAASWSLLTHLMNMLPDTPQEFYVQVRFYYVQTPPAVEPVKPVWLDIDNCGDSEYRIPAGFSDTHRDFTVPGALAGNVVAIGGHLHNAGRRISATNETAGGTLCTSRASYGSHGGETMLDGMGTCAGNRLAHISAGDVIRLHSEYNSPTVQNDVMGIMLGYVDVGGL
jgi:hypothetical protein